MKPSRIQCAASQFITSAASRSQATSANYQQAINQFLKAGHNRLDSVATIAFLNSLKTRDLSNSSRATYISGARAFLKHLMDEGLIPTTPLHLLKRPRITRSRVNYLSEADAIKLIQCAQDAPTTLAALSLLLGLGLRVSEAINSQWRHLYEESGCFGLLIPCAKGGQSRITVVPPTILTILQECRRRQNRTIELNSMDHSFILNHNDQPYTRQYIFRIIATTAIKAGLQRNVGPHTLRHTFATLAARAGAQPYDLQQSLGHQKLETTMFYVHLVSSLKNPTSAIVAPLFRQCTDICPQNRTG